MRILFLGTSEFAVPTLRALVSSRHEVLAVVTQPDKPQGRGQRVASSPVKHAALQLGLPLLQPRRVRAASFLEVAEGLAPEALVLAAFGQIIPQALLDLPPLGPINLHGSLLPAYRGAAPIQHAILNGETVTGLTTMWMDATLDTGDLLLQEEVPILPSDTAGTLTERMADAGAPLVLKTLDCLEAASCARVAQDHDRATWAPALTAEDGRVHWTDGAGRIRDRLRALSPRPGAFASFGARRLKLWAAQIAANDAPDAGPGTVVAIGQDGVAVQTGREALLLTEVQQEGSRRMGAAEWARGARLRPGDALSDG